MDTDHKWKFEDFEAVFLRTCQRNLIQPEFTSCFGYSTIRSPRLSLFIESNLDLSSNLFYIWDRDLVIAYRSRHMFYGKLKRIYIYQGCILHYMFYSYNLLNQNRWHTIDYSRRIIY